MEGSSILLGLLEVILPSLAFALGLHLLSCVCLSCLGAGEAWGEPLPVDFWQQGGEDLLSITAVPGLPALLWCFT